MNSVLTGEQLSAKQINMQPKNNQSVSKAVQEENKAAKGKPDSYDSYHNNIAPDSLSTLINNITNTSIEFINNSAEEVSYISIIDKTTNEVLRTFPTEEMRNVLNKIEEHSGCYIDTDI